MEKVKTTKELEAQLDDFCKFLINIRKMSEVELMEYIRLIKEQESAREGASLGQRTEAIRKNKKL